MYAANPIRRCGGRVRHESFLISSGLDPPFNKNTSNTDEHFMINDELPSSRALVAGSRKTKSRDPDGNAQQV
ncbi:hypothetical protein A0H81_06844 [Grifola frondosa]|uniref:Uncharacterized protein n=1 Tax=Grifola frondosa TaxID=5627 RepID=A0A1C7M7I8_GRIFR|nr:hypothetical protein A0H81_06844 [Grifola frondosa]